MNVFVVRDRTGRAIRLTKERWKHVSREHPEIASYLEEMKDVLQKPTQVVQRADSSYHYRYEKERAEYLLVIVKYLNNHGFIITAYFTRNLK